MSAYYCDHCCEEFTCFTIASRHLYEMEITVNMTSGQKDFVLEIKRDPELSSE